MQVPRVRFRIFRTERRKKNAAKKKKKKMGNSDSSLSHSAVNHSLSSVEWDPIDKALHSLLSPLHASLSRGDLDTSEAGELFSQTLFFHLQSCGRLP